MRNPHREYSDSSILQHGIHPSKSTEIQIPFSCSGETSHRYISLYAHRHKAKCLAGQTEVARPADGRQSQNAPVLTEKEGSLIPAAFGMCSAYSVIAHNRSGNLLTAVSVSAAMKHRETLQHRHSLRPELRHAPATTDSPPVEHTPPRSDSAITARLIASRPSSGRLLDTLRPRILAPPAFCIAFATSASLERELRLHPSTTRSYSPTDGNVLRSNASQAPGPPELPRHRGVAADARLDGGYVAPTG